MSWTEIESITLGSPAASVTFSSGLTAYKFFRLTVYILNDANAKNIQVRFNNDSGSNYTRQAVSAASTGVSGERPAATTSVEINTGNNITASETASVQVLVAKPAAGVKGQVVYSHGYNASPSLILGGAEWNNTADLISRIDVIALSNTFAAGTSILLEGLSF